jgi:small nuclear ribonucleoprotein (snRNP)-like protein
MGIDESFEAAESLKGHFVVIVRTDGSEITGRLTEIEDLTAILADDDSHQTRISLGDVNWISRVV